MVLLYQNLLQALAQVVEAEDSLAEEDFPEAEVVGGGGGAF